MLQDPVKASDDVRIGSGTGSIEYFHAVQRGFWRNANGSDLVINSCHDPGNVGSMSVIVLARCAPHTGRDEFIWMDVGGKVGIAQVDAGIHDSYPDTCSIRDTGYR